MKGKFLSIIVSIITAPCLIYYFIKFYTEGSLHFGHENLLAFSIFVGLLLIVILRLVFVESKLDEISTILSDLEKTVDYCHDQNVKLHKNSRIYMTDLYNKEDNDNEK